MEETSQNGDTGVGSDLQNLIADLTTKLDQANSRIDKFEADETNRQQMQMLDTTLANMHTEHGDFNDEFVLAQIASGKTPQEAVEAFNTIKKSIIDSHSETAPNLLSGPAGTPLDQVDMTKLKTAKDRQAFGAALLAKANQQS